MRFNIRKVGIVAVATALSMLLPTGSMAQFRIVAGETISIQCSSGEMPVVHSALELLSRDLASVLEVGCAVSDGPGKIMVGTLGQPSVSCLSESDRTLLEGLREGFLLKVVERGRLLVAGSDPHGTAYGVLEISRLLGVSPWEWWADVTPSHKDIFELPAGFNDIQHPDVQYRGIFINDEDWGMMQWSSLTYEPWYKAGRIGPKTNERIFELLLRLRANTYWPAMHEVTVPFFLTPGNREAAEKYGIYIGGSHCEPMACSTAGEWPKRGKGEYNYVNNSEAVYKFWEDRVKEVAGQDIFYTLGMRGVHDGQMNGARTVQEQKAVLERVFKDQRELLAKYVDENVEDVPQVFIPYKEVQAVYEAGLEVPDDMTLMWCDDNYGYIRHYPTAEERARKGGNGIYYHVSYWGGPHDHLWLGTFSPSLLYQQMRTAYDNDIRKLWILNVGDIKPAEYQIEMFMDMAWDIEKVSEEGLHAHLEAFLQREFGDKAGSALTPVMQEHYRLAYIRKPEFMGNQDAFGEQWERKIKDMPWSLEYLDRRLEAYGNLSDAVIETEKEIPERLKDAYYQLVEYPVRAATEMNRKLIYAQKARHGLMDWSASDEAYDNICRLTRIYNVGIHNGGKWHRMMDHQPRRLPVFEPVDRDSATTAMVMERPVLYKWNATECASGEYRAWEGLGYEGKAAGIAKGKSITFETERIEADSVKVEVRLLPCNPIEGGRLRFSVSLDGIASEETDILPEYHSSEWEQNVLSNQAIRILTLPVSKARKHRLTFSAIDEGIVLDQIFITTKSE